MDFINQSGQATWKPAFCQGIQHLLKKVREFNANFKNQGSQGIFVFRMNAFEFLSTQF